MHTDTAVSSLNSNRKPLPLWLRAGFWICTAIAVAVVIRRLFALAAPPRSSAAPQLAALDHFFASHAVLTLAHIIPALGFVLVAPFVVLRERAWAEWVVYPLGAIVGLTAYAMSSHAIGGWTERSAVLFYNSLFLLCLLRAYLYGARQDALLERRWLLRAIAILLGIATTRPVMGVFFATSRLTHLTPQQFFGIAFWIGFSINTLVFEVWIRSRSGHQQTVPLRPVDDDERDDDRAHLRRIS